VERGAAIYVCGSLNGMGQGVHLTLQAILGEAKVAELLGSGRYRRDVY
jgi:sulfite reductase (NADPH) flavoprotein alpha-component